MKKASTILLAVLMGLGFSIIALRLGGATSARAAADILYVAPGGACGGSVPNCYASLQAAVDAAAPGDEIRAAAGTYTDLSVRPRRDITTTGSVTQTLYLSKTVTVRGGYSNDFSAWNPDLYATILDAQGKGRGVYVTGEISPTIDGLHITGGDARGMTGYGYYGAYDAGGGVYVMTATTKFTAIRLRTAEAASSWDTAMADSKVTRFSTITSIPAVVGAYSSTMEPPL